MLVTFVPWSSLCVGRSDLYRVCMNVGYLCSMIISLCWQVWFIPCVYECWIPLFHDHLSVLAGLIYTVCVWMLDTFVPWSSLCVGRSDLYRVCMNVGYLCSMIISLCWQVWFIPCVYECWIPLFHDHLSVLAGLIYTVCVWMLDTFVPWSSLCVGRSDLYCVCMNVRYLCSMIISLCWKEDLYRVCMIMNVRYLCSTIISLCWQVWFIPCVFEC